jgi:uncharacterized membrane protein
MNPARSESSRPPRARKQHPFRRAVLRGLAVVLPSLLTIVVFIWAWTTIEHYVLRPVEAGAQWLLVWRTAEVYDQPPADRDPDEYVLLKSGRYIPREVYDRVAASHEQVPTTSDEFYERYVKIRWLRRLYVIPVFLTVFVLCLYMLGRFLAAGAGRLLFDFFEGLIRRLPIVRNVYSSVKQVTDFVFSEREIEYTRVVAVEYPRKGVWTLAFVTGEGMLDIRSAANQPVLTVLVPHSPVPVTGFTATVLKSETIDLNITIDQAIQFIVSCGVVAPPHQRPEQTGVGAEISAAIARRAAAGEDGKARSTTPASSRTPAD